MVLSGQWSGKGVFNMEQFDPDPFMATVLTFRRRLGLAVEGNVSRKYV